MKRTDIYRSMAERCYRLAGACTDPRMEDALLDYAGECEAKAGSMDGATFADILPAPPAGGQCVKGA
jgi:hypothetical protein